MLLGLTLIGVGLWVFEPMDFLENLIAEAVGLTFALAIIILLVEGPVLTRQRRVRAILAYKKKGFQKGAEIGNLIVTDMAQLITRDFEPYIDLYGPERGNWEEFEPLLRQVFISAMEVRRHGVPDYPSLNEEIARSFMKGCEDMAKRTQEIANSKPEFNKWEILGNFSLALIQIVHHIERAEKLDLLSNPTERYVAIGELGYLLLEMLKGINSSSEGTELW